MPEPVRLLITGSRHWTNVAAIEAELRPYPPGTVVMHGCNGYDENGRPLVGRPDSEAVRGADMLAGAVAERLGFAVERYPVDHALDGPWPAAGPRRNQRMVDEGRPTEALAFVLPGSRGTWDAVRRCKQAGIPVKIVRGWSVR